MGGVESSVKIGIDERVPCFRAEALHRAIARICSARVHEDIDTPELLHRFFHQQLHLLGARDIGASNRDVTSLLSQLLFQRFQSPLTARRCHDMCALTSEEHCGRSTYAAGGPKN